MAGKKNKNRGGGSQPQGSNQQQSTKKKEDPFADVRPPGNAPFQFNFAAPGATAGAADKDSKDKPAKGAAPAIDLKGQEAALLPFLQKKMNKLVGTSSGYFESLPKSVRDRVNGLKCLHKQKEDLETLKKKETDAIDQKYQALFKPLFDRRTAIITGSQEPTAEEKAFVDESAKDDDDDAAAPPKVEPQAPETPEDKAIVGIPGFWLEALRHTDEVGDTITKEDEVALAKLTNITVEHVEKKAEEGAPEFSDSQSFALTFHFADNEFFSNKTIVKSYYLFEEGNEVMFDHVECTPILWKSSAKNLTVKMVAKQERAKRGRGRGRGGRGGGGGAGKTVMVEEPCESFFHFFTVPSETEMESEELQDFLEEDYEIGLTFKEEIIPAAVMYYTGEANVGGFGEDDSADDDDDDDDGDDDDEDDDDDDDGEGRPANNDEDDSEEDDDYDPKKDTQPQAGGDPANCPQQ